VKLVRFLHKTETGYGILEGETIRAVKEPPGDWDENSFAQTGRAFPAEAVRLLAPCKPSKVLCVGLNYRSHAAEMGAPLPESPVLFIKPPTAVIGPGEPILYPPQSGRVDYEAELGVVIGKTARHVSRAAALEYVFGYTCANDVTARDLQPPAGQWTYAKGFDTFCPLGPVIETDIGDPESLYIQSFLNGKPVQAAPTAEHIFSVAALVEFISGCMTLLPGDVIITGTPAGIGPLQPGDTFEVLIKEIGRLANPCARPA
jgi:2-keto-4-pentenoate hydratase/2-oxohepta-3-ene-1,7-dioic acid hydratase in catechol pathway